jgi:nucleoid-associated protein YgaU
MKVSEKGIYSLGTSVLQSIRRNETSASIMFGLVVICVVLLLGYQYILANKQVLLSEHGQINEAGMYTESSLENPLVYTVKPGDSLWKIAVAQYGDGTMWKKIAITNALTHENQIEIGSRLTLPVVEGVGELSNDLTIVPVNDHRSVITDTNYTVQPGDSLWKISVRAFGDGYRFMSIFKANSNLIKNPDLIYVGWKLTIPR